MTTEEPRGARTHALPLPQARQVKRAVNSLETGLEASKPPGVQHPMGDRGYAAQYLGMLKAVAAQVEEGLRGGPLETEVQKGWFGAYSRDVPSIFHADEVVKQSEEMYAAADMLADYVVKKQQGL